MEFGYALAVIVAQAAVAWVGYQRLSKAVQDVRHEATRNANNVISQVEGLLAIHAEVRPQRALPKSRGWAASPDFLSVLITLVQERRPETVVECSSGYSTIVLAAALRNVGRGKVISLEHDAVYAAKTRNLLRLHGLSDWATVVDAPTTVAPQSFGDWKGNWYDASRLSGDLRIDLLVVDGPPQDTNPLARFPAVPALFERLVSGAMIVLDDADRPDETLTIKRWLDLYPALEVVNVSDCEKGCVALRLAESRVPARTESHA